MKRTIRSLVLATAVLAMSAAAFAGPPAAISQRQTRAGGTQPSSGQPQPFNVRGTIHLGSAGSGRTSGAKVTGDPRLLELFIEMHYTRGK